MLTITDVHKETGDYIRENFVKGQDKEALEAMNTKRENYNRSYSMTTKWATRLFRECV